MLLGGGEDTYLYDGYMAVGLRLVCGWFAALCLAVIEPIVREVAVVQYYVQKKGDDRRTSNITVTNYHPMSHPQPHRV